MNILRLRRRMKFAIILNYDLAEEKALFKDGIIYLNFNYVHDKLNDRFYWDANENILLYTTSANVVKASADSKDYYIGRKKIQRLIRSYL